MDPHGREKRLTHLPNANRSLVLLVSPFWCIEWWQPRRGSPFVWSKRFQVRHPTWSKTKPGESLPLSLQGSDRPGADDDHLPADRGEEQGQMLQPKCRCGCPLPPGIAGRVGLKQAWWLKLIYKTDDRYAWPYESFWKRIGFRTCGIIDMVS